MRPPLLLPLLLIASVFVLAACGGGGGEDAQIEEAVESAATSTTQADCKKFETQRFMEQTTKSTGSAAVESCEEQASNDEGVEAATVSSVEIKGSEAIADATLSGGPFDGQEVEIALVKDGEQWKLNEIAGFIKFNAAKVITAFEKEFAKPSSGVSKPQATCVVESFEAAPEAELEGALLSPSTKGFEEIAGSCFS